MCVYSQLHTHSCPGTILSSLEGNPVKDWECAFGPDCTQVLARAWRLLAAPQISDKCGYGSLLLADHGVL